MIIAIDGPAASGKSTVAKLLAKKLDFIHFGTGKMYRAITAYCIKENLVDLSNEKISKKINSINFSFNNESLSNLLIDGLNYSDYYYSNETNYNVSKISCLKSIRTMMVSLQRKYSFKKNLVCEGRDIGTVVFPRADFKFFVEASVECRAKRRFKEINNNDVSLKDIENLLIKRDNIDMNRKISPLKKAADAILIDTTLLSIDQVVDNMYEKIKKENKQ